MQDLVILMIEIPEKVSKMEQSNKALFLRISVIANAYLTNSGNGCSEYSKIRSYLSFIVY
ncbi:hypothetical protein THOG05_320006 [Vibrio rotiferianus]|nr:hypothetical protein THOG05_320006 [Vibrio rotiferianus]